MRELLSVLITLSPPVRRGNDLQEQVDVPAGKVYRQAKHAGTVQLSDEVIKPAWERGVNLNPKF